MVLVLCFAHGGLFACIGKGDVAKLNFTLAALEAEDPFAKKVSLADLVALSHERMCWLGVSVRRQSCSVEMAGKAHS